MDQYMEDFNMDISCHEEYLINHCRYEHDKQQILWEAKQKNMTDDELCCALRDILLKYGLYQKEE